VLEDVRSIPPRVTVTGPERLLEQMDEVTTKGIWIYGRTETFRREVELVLEAELPLADGVAPTVQLEAEPGQVTAVVMIRDERERASETKVFKDIPVGVLRPTGFPYKVVIPPESATVSATVSGSPESVKRLRKDEIRAFVDLERLTEERIEPGKSAPYKEQVSLILPPGKDLTSGKPEPETITIILENPAQ